MVFSLAKFFFLFCSPLASHFLHEFHFLQMIQCDIASHRAAVDTALENGMAMVNGKSTDELTKLEEQLGFMNEEWQALLAKARDKQVTLEQALREVNPNKILLIFSQNTDE